MQTTLPYMNTPFTPGINMQSVSALCTGAHNTLWSDLSTVCVQSLQRDHILKEKSPPSKFKMSPTLALSAGFSMPREKLQVAAAAASKSSLAKFYFILNKINELILCDYCPWHCLLDLGGQFGQTCLHIQNHIMIQFTCFRNVLVITKSSSRLSHCNSQQHHLTVDITRLLWQELS